MLLLNGCGLIEIGPGGVQTKDTVYISCTESLYEPIDSLVHDRPDNQGVENARLKAYMLACIEWTPKAAIPSTYDAPYMPGVTKRGVPYSLAQQTNSFVGLDVSLYTFLTAVDNPMSVMYTEDLSKEPYNGFDCASYYGAVCSTSIWYALGIGIPYYTRHIEKMKELEKLDSMAHEDIRLCDVLWKSGHVCMVFDIGRDSTGVIRTVSIFETTRTSQLDATVRTYTWENFEKRWQSNHWTVYRYKQFERNTMQCQEPFAIVNNKLVPTYIANRDVCTARGDRASYCSEEDVVICALDGGYDEMEIYRDQELVEVRPLTGTTATLQELPYGQYQVRLRSGNRYSDFTCFEVIDTQVSLEYGAKLRIRFSSANGTAEYVEQCDFEDRPEAPKQLSDADRANGYVDMNYCYSYCKVHFKGEYGRVCPQKIWIER